jgi:hypothetical protein
MAIKTYSLRLYASFASIKDLEREFSQAVEHIKAEMSVAEENEGWQFHANLGGGGLDFDCVEDPFNPPNERGQVDVYASRYILLRNKQWADLDKYVPSEEE